MAYKSQNIKMSFTKPRWRDFHGNKDSTMVFQVTACYDTSILECYAASIFSMK